MTLYANQGCSNPSIPSCLSPHAANTAGFRGLVLHSSRFNQELPNILAAVKSTQEGSDIGTGNIVIIGCGKSAQEYVLQSSQCFSSQESDNVCSISAYLANQGRKVSVVFEHLEPYLATPRPLPAILRKSRYDGPRDHKLILCAD